MKPFAVLLAITLMIIALNLSAQTGPEAGVDLIWEAETTAPSFYLGKARPTPQARVRVVAIPEAPASNLIYRWEKDGKQLGGVSGQGENVLVFRAGAAGEVHRIAVTVENQSRAVLAKNELLVAVQSPRIVFYEEDPLLGLQTIALGEIFNLTRPELTVVAVPYFFDVNQALEYRWRLNNEPIVSDIKRPEAITLIAPAAGAGDNVLELIVNNPVSSQQSARRRLEFTNQKTDFAF